MTTSISTKCAPPGITSSVSGDPGWGEAGERPPPPGVNQQKWVVGEGYRLLLLLQ